MCNFSKLIFLEICYFFGKIGEYKFSLCEYKLSLCFLSPLRGGRNFTTILEKLYLIFPKEWNFFGKNSLFPSQCPTKQMQYGRAGSVGDSIPPGPVSLGIQLCLSMCFLSFPCRSLLHQLCFRFTFPFFCMYRMRLLLFWVHFRPHCRSVDLSCISCAFVLRFRSSACTACVYYSFERTFGPTVARSISPASVALSFYVSVLLHVPHASITLLSALSAPLSLGRSLLHQLRFRFTFPFFCMYRMRLSLFWVHFRPHYRSVDLSCISCAFVLRFRSSACIA